MNTEAQDILMDSEWDLFSRIIGNESAADDAIQTGLKPNHFADDVVRGFTDRFVSCGIMTDLLRQMKSSSLSSVVCLSHNVSDSWTNWIRSVSTRSAARIRNISPEKCSGAGWTVYTLSPFAS